MSNQNHHEYKFLQLNFKKSLQASVEFIKKTRKIKNFVCLATEPYISFDKVGNAPPGSKTFCGDKNPRAAIIFDKDIGVVGINKLSNRDCAVAFVKIDKVLTVVASVYCDINLAMIQPILQELIDFVTANHYPILIGMDSNAHSTLYGKETNKRGELLEDFIFTNGLEVKNVVGETTFVTTRGENTYRTCIDVTLARDMPTLKD